jgi:sugar lactone lactonase YvrE
MKLTRFLLGCLVFAAAFSAHAAEPLKSELLAVLPDYINTPDGMCLLPDGNVIVSVPNINDDTQNAFLLKVTPDDEVSIFYPCPDHPVTKKAYPFGITVGPNGDIYYADLQWFANPEDPGFNSRVMRIPMVGGKPGKAETFASGMVVANAVIIRGGYLYVSDTMMIPGSKPLISGVFRFRLDEAGVELKQPISEDPHLITTMKSYHPEIGFGADGMTFDSKGHLYIGNFADGTLHQVKFDAQGNPSPSTIFAKADFMKSCDGIFCDVTTDEIYVADSVANAVQVVSADGSVRTLVQSPASDGLDGGLDQPCEVLLRGDELIISNFDFPVPGGVNTEYETPGTLSKVRLR